VHALHRWLFYVRQIAYVNRYMSYENGANYSIVRDFLDIDIQAFDIASQRIF